MVSLTSDKREIQYVKDIGEEKFEVKTYGYDITRIGKEIKSKE